MNISKRIFSINLGLLILSFCFIVTVLISHIFLIDTKLGVNFLTERKEIFLLLGYIVMLIGNLFYLKKFTKCIKNLIRKVGAVKYGSFEPFDAKKDCEIRIIGDALNEMLLRLKTGYEQEKCNQKKIIQTEKINIVEELAATASHEIRNPLTVIKGFTQLLQKEIENDCTSANYTRIILNEVAAIEHTIKQFLLQYRPTFPELSYENIHDILNEILPLLVPKAVDRKLSINIDYGQNIRLMQLDKEQIKQLFLNVGLHAITNAKIGGEISLKTIFNSAKNSVLISFSYNAISHIMDAEDNINMSTSYRIVNNHRGNFLINTTKDENTMYSISLPVLE